MGLSLPPPIQLNGYRLATVCAVLGVSEKALRRAAARGAVKLTGIGHLKLVEESELRRLMAEGLRPMNSPRRRRDSASGKFIPSAPP